MIDIDDSQVQALFSRLTSREQDKAFKQTLRKAGNILVKATRNQLKRVVRNSNKRSVKYGKSLQSGVKCKLVKENGANVAKVHIMGDFRLKFFEKGTTLRRTKGHRITGYIDVRHLRRTGRGGNRGRIRSTYFFDKAKRTSETSIFESMNQMLKESILRAANNR